MSNNIKNEIKNFEYIVEILKKSKYYRKRRDSELKTSIVFISHSSKDKHYVSTLVNLLEDIRLKRSQLFCSSIPGYDIPLDKDIYEYLKSLYKEYNLHIIFILSNNYYQSAASLNEMGAAWVLQIGYTSILLPGFDFKEIKGAINPNKVALKLDGDLSDVKEKLGQLKDSLIEKFSIEPIPNIRWEEKRDAFISTINSSRNSSQFSDAAIELLKAACSDSQGTIMRFHDLSGTTISVGPQQFIKSQERREVAKWEAALNELMDARFVTQKGRTGEIHTVTQLGYNYWKSINNK